MGTLRIWTFLPVLPALLAAVTLPAAAQEPPPVEYALDQGSTYQSGCFAPCDCPILQELPLEGTFDLVLLPTAGPLTTFAFEKVDWTVPTLDRKITGSGFYTLAGQYYQLSLSLSLDGAPAEEFTSGFVATGAKFPEIDAVVSMNQMYCYDVVLHVVASPVTGFEPVLSVATDSLSWTAWPGASFDLVCGDLGYLSSSGGDFTGATDQCLAADYAGSGIPFTAIPASGDGLWFLVREVGGTYDSGAGSQVEPRDDEIDASPAACP